MSEEMIIKLVDESEGIDAQDPNDQDQQQQPTNEPQPKQQPTNEPRSKDVPPASEGPSDKKTDKILDGLEKMVENPGVDPAIPKSSDSESSADTEEIAGDVTSPNLDGLEMSAKRAGEALDSISNRTARDKIADSETAARTEREQERNQESFQLTKPTTDPEVTVVLDQNQLQPNVPAGEPPASARPETAQSIREGIEQRKRERAARREAEERGQPAPIPRTQTGSDGPPRRPRSSSIRDGIDQRRREREAKREAEDRRRQRSNPVGRQVRAARVRTRRAFSRAGRRFRQSRLSPRNIINRARRSRTGRRARIVYKRSVAPLLSRIAEHPAAKKVISTASRAAGPIASRAGAATGAARAGATAVGGVGVAAGLAIASVTAGLVLMAAAVFQTTRSFLNQAEKLEQFSGVLFGARQSNRNEELGNQVERAAKIGPQLAQVEAAKGRFNDAYFDLVTEIYTEVAKLAPLLEFGVDATTTGLRGVETLVNLAQALYQLTSLNPKNAQKELLEANFSALKMAQAFKSIFGEDNVVRGSGVDAILDHDPFGGQRNNQIGANPAPDRFDGDPFFGQDPFGGP